MIKKSLKILASLIIGLAMVACVNGDSHVTELKKIEPTKEELASLYKQELKAGEKWGDVKIENRSDCLLVAVTVLEVVSITEGVEAMELVHGGWYDVGETESIQLIIGRKYIIMVEAFQGDKKKGQEMKVGKLVDAPNNDILVHCIHTEPRMAAPIKDVPLPTDGKTLSLTNWSFNASCDVNIFRVNYTDVYVKGEGKISHYTLDNYALVTVGSGERETTPMEDGEYFLQITCINPDSGKTIGGASLSMSWPPKNGAMGDLNMSVDGKPKRL
jgi:hypothetical protein